MTRREELRSSILDLVREYHGEAFPALEFVPGESTIPVSGKVFDGDEMSLLVDSSLDFWLTSGRFAETFEIEIARRLGIRHAMLCNSGSSANLLAVTALTSDRLGNRRLRPGDEVLTTAAGFPTTVNPIIQNGLVPVFVDVELGTYEAMVDRLAEAVGPRTRAIMLAHTLGNAFDLGSVTALAREHGLWLIEDNCDALGTTYDGKPTGTFGDLSTLSFYPAHHITMGEGGCVLTNRPSIKKIVESFRDWGRDCWCDPGKDNTCAKRFDWELGALPRGYDHKYIYTHIGYNLKLTDMQAAVGVAQLDKLDGFIEARRKNFAYLLAGLQDLNCFILPRATERSDPSWFGFCLTVKRDAGFSRRELVQFLESRRIGTRQLFGGNLVKQPAYVGLPHRIVGDLANADLVADGSFWLGVYPGLTEPMLDYVVASLREFVSSQKRARTLTA